MKGRTNQSINLSSHKVRRTYVPAGLRDAITIIVTATTAVNAVYRDLVKTGERRERLMNKSAAMTAIFSISLNRNYTNTNRFSCFTFALVNLIL